MFEVTVLGTASAVPTIRRSLPSIAVRHDGDVFLLDCGEGAQRQLMKYSVSYMRVKAIFLSHLHLDHFLGAFGLIETMGLNNRTEKLTIYGPRGTSAIFNRKSFLETVEIADGFSCEFMGFTATAFQNAHSRDSFGFVFEEKSKRRFYEEKAKAAGLRGPMFTQLMEKGELAVGKKKIRLKDVTYEQPGKKLAYSGDTGPCPALVKAAKGADLLIHEATFCSDRAEEAKQAKHSTAAQAAAAAKKAGAKRLLLTHISGRYADPAPILVEAKKAFPHSQVAEDGLKIEV